MIDKLTYPTREEIEAKLADFRDKASLFQDPVIFSAVDLIERLTSADHVITDPVERPRLNAMREVIAALELAGDRFDQAERGIWADDAREAAKRLSSAPVPVPDGMTNAQLAMREALLAAKSKIEKWPISNLAIQAFERHEDMRSRDSVLRQIDSALTVPDAMRDALELTADRFERIQHQSWADDARKAAALSPLDAVAAEPDAWQKRPTFGENRKWTNIEHPTPDNFKFWFGQDYEVRPLYATPPVRGDREAIALTRGGWAKVLWLSGGGSSDDWVWWLGRDTLGNYSARKQEAIRIRECWRDADAILLSLPVQSGERPSSEAILAPLPGGALALGILNSLEETAKYLRRADPATIDMDGITQVLLTSIKQLRPFLSAGVTGRKYGPVEWSKEVLDTVYGRPSPAVAAEPPWRAGRREFPEMQLIVGSLDTAFKEKEENDFKVIK